MFVLKVQHAQICLTKEVGPNLGVSLGPSRPSLYRNASGSNSGEEAARPCPDSAPGFCVGHFRPHGCSQHMTNLHTFICEAFRLLCGNLLQFLQCSFHSSSPKKTTQFRSWQAKGVVLHHTHMGGKRDPVPNFGVANRVGNKNKYTNYVVYVPPTYQCLVDFFGKSQHM